MMQLKFDLTTEAKTEQLAAHMARVLSAPLVLGFRGEIGAGKTTFIRAMLRSLGVVGSIKSPTYALVESYLIKDLPIYHFDLYRIQEASELDYIGFRDYFASPSICCIEWSERLQQEQDLVDMQLTMCMNGDGRALHINGVSPRGCQVLSLFLQELPSCFSDA
jgi:tRNA threonylcarbamoyladenosine biosynthesis protein TsaE